MTTENPVSISTTPNSPSNLEFAIAAAEAAANTRCQNVVVMDLRGRSPVTEFFVIATGTSARQMRTVADEVQDLGKNLNYKAWQKSGYESARWILVDFVHVVVHVFDPDSRAFYDLEILWGDAPRIDWRAALGLPPATPEELAPAAADDGMTGLDAGGWEETPETDLLADAGHDDYLAESPTIEPAADAADESVAADAEEMPFPTADRGERARRAADLFAAGEEEADEDLTQEEKIAAARRRAAKAAKAQMKKAPVKAPVKASGKALKKAAPKAVAKPKTVKKTGKKVVKKAAKKPPAKKATPPKAKKNPVKKSAQKKSAQKTSSPKKSVNKKPVAKKKPGKKTAKKRR